METTLVGGRAVEGVSVVDGRAACQQGVRRGGTAVVLPVSQVGVGVGPRIETKAAGVAIVDVVPIIADRPLAVATGGAVRKDAVGDGQGPRIINRAAIRRRRAVIGEGAVIDIHNALPVGNTAPIGVCTVAGEGAVRDVQRATFMIVNTATDVCAVAGKGTVRDVER